MIVIESLIKLIKLSHSYLLFHQDINIDNFMIDCNVNKLSNLYKNDLYQYIKECLKTLIFIDFGRSIEYNKQDIKNINDAIQKDFYSLYESLEDFLSEKDLNTTFKQF